jgi:pyruvate dehydrogenase E1 component alpha subunit
MAGATRLSAADLNMLLLIRHFELKLLELFASGHIAGTTHTCLGQEYIPVALTPLLTPAFTFSNHRGHGHYLAQFGDIDGLLAEICGREGAVCGGHGGSQHIFRDGYCSTGVQGAGVSTSLGVALHMKSVGRPDLVVAYVGDGTWGQGTVYEVLNMAVLWRLPLVVVVENNGIAQSTPTSLAMAGTIAGRAAAFGARYEYVEGTCVVAIRELLTEPLARTRDGAGPLVIEFRTGRLGPHSKGDDTRSAADMDRLREGDWYTTYPGAHPHQFAEADVEQRELVDRLAREVLARPLAGVR